MKIGDIVRVTRYVIQNELGEDHFHWLGKLVRISNEFPDFFDSGSGWLVVSGDGKHSHIFSTGELEEKL